MVGDSDKEANFDCPDYEAERGSLRCRNYLDGGRCELESYVMCVEWLRTNPDSPIPVTGPLPVSEFAADSVTPDGPVLSLAPVAVSQATLSPPCEDVVENQSGVPSSLDLVTEQSLADLAATGAEVDLKLRDGTMLTLVPDYTAAERSEITYRDCATVVECIRVFPGARFESFRAKGSE